MIVLGRPLGRKAPDCLAEPGGEDEGVEEAKDLKSLISQPR